ncbi:MAG: pentapeptide repeat-containing protein [Leptolyngbyaceae cyanobacterium MAG.088]|nr:pentapeptide repeat-containing protein [Leptolyngbyaceae cyanobacterium MAG.088]
MIAVDYLELIEQGVDVWNRWRSEHPDEYPELESAYLFEKSLQGINLSKANLRRACLIGANLEGADLTGANLSGAYANNTNLQRAKLSAANLQDSNFIDANLNQADLSDAMTDNANFTNASLDGTCLADKSAISIAPPTPVTARRPAASPVLRERVETKRNTASQLIIIVGSIALSTTALYLALRPKSPKFVTPDGTVTIQLVCNEPDVTPLSAQVPEHVYQNGTRFYGPFKDGKPATGRGSMLYSNGNRYDGEYRNGQRNGCGTFTFDNGRRYVGEFHNDLFSGRGVWMLENGDRYIGDFEFNKCNGEGVYMFADGTSKSGIWQQGRLVDGDVTCDHHAIDLPKS